MPFDPATFCDLANILRRSSNGDDARLRSSISRAYYGAFIVARDAAGVSSFGKSGHTTVIDYYAGGNAQDQIISDALKRLKAMRERADYSPSSQCRPAEGDMALGLSSKVIRALRRPPP